MKLGSGMGKKRAGYSNERGAVAILVAASLVMLMGFAAVAVDTGAAFSERRQDQSASDMAALAAVQFARGSDDEGTAANNGADAAIAVAGETLDVTLEANAWTNCADPDRPSEFVVISDSPCISFTSNLQKARVVIPPIDVPTAFGGVVGVESIETSAFAEAQGDVAQEGRVMPFGLPGGSAGDIEVCLKDSGGHPVPPCDGPDSGNFGTLDFSLFGNPSQGTEKQCAPGQGPARLVVNMAAGVDHPISTGTGRLDEDYCAIFNSRPNMVGGRTGNISGSLYDGMVGGTGTLIDPNVNGRLARGANRTEVNSDPDVPTIDDTPLWIFIDGDSDKPSSCVGVTDTSGMHDCLSDWNPATYSDPLFALPIGEAVRFGAVPVLGADEWDGGSNPAGYDIADIVPIYLQATLWKCNGSNPCDIIHYPDDPTASSGLGSDANKKLDQLTAFVLHLDMLPEPLRSNFPTTAEQVEYALVR